MDRVALRLPATRSDFTDRRSNQELVAPADTRQCLGSFHLINLLSLPVTFARGWLKKPLTNRLLFILPALFIPIYVAGIGQGQFWSQVAGILLPALLVATASLWIFVGHLSQRFLSGSDE